MSQKISHHRFYANVGDAIRHLRKESGISKHKVATIMGVSISKYISMEEGLEEITLYDVYFFSGAIGRSFEEVVSFIAQNNVP